MSAPLFAVDEVVFIGNGREPWVVVAVTTTGRTPTYDLVSIRRLGRRMQGVRQERLS